MEINSFRILKKCRPFYEKIDEKSGNNFLFLTFDMTDALLTIVILLCLNESFQTTCPCKNAFTRNTLKTP